MAACIRIECSAWLNLIIRLFTSAGAGALAAMTTSFSKTGVDGDTRAAMVEAMFVGELSDVRERYQESTKIKARLRVMIKGD